MEFDPRTAHTGQVDPAELVGRTIRNICHIRYGATEDPRWEPSSQGISFQDGSKYHVRVARIHGVGDVNFSADGEELEGEEILEASLFRQPAHEFERRARWSNWSADRDHVTLGIKVSTGWWYFEAEERKARDGLGGGGTDMGTGTDMEVVGMEVGTGTGTNTGAGMGAAVGTEAGAGMGAITATGVDPGGDKIINDLAETRRIFSIGQCYQPKWLQTLSGISRA
ncbi:hypothetical protein HWV62_19485 [Athelia sp. TMB]|nr:hypothetical protein HWV62_19485 [Athelia sp. TMB]